MTTSDLLNDLEDARDELKALERMDKRARKMIAAGITDLAATAAAIAATSNGIYAWALLPAAALFAFASVDLYQTQRTVEIENRSWSRSALGRLDLARQKVRKAEQAYAAAVMKDAEQ